MKYFLLSFIVLQLCINTANAQNGLSCFNLNAGTRRSSAPTDLQVVNNKLFFAAFTDTVGTEIFMYNDTLWPSALTDVNHGKANSVYLRPMCMTSINDTIYYVGDTSLDTVPRHCSIYKISPGTATPSKASNVVVPTFNVPSNVSILSAGKSVIYTTFKADSLMYVVSVNPSSLIPDTLIKLPPRTYIKEIMPCGNRLYFTSFEGYSPAPNYYNFSCFDIATHKTTLLDSANFYIGEYTGNKLVIGNDLYYLKHDASFHGFEILKHDGINAPVRLTHTYQKPGDLSIHGFDSCLGIHNNKIFYTTSSAYDTLHLTSYDLSTGKVSDAPNTNIFNTYFYANNFISYHNKLFFTAYTIKTGMELFVYDGVNTPKLVADISPGKLGSSPHSFCIYHDNLYFSATIFNTIWTQLFKYNDSTLSLTNITGGITPIAAYPNPVTQDAHLSISLKNATTFTIQLIDLNGRVVYSQQPQVYSTGKHTLNIPMQQLQAGMYFYRIDDNTGQLLGSGKLQKL